MPGKQKTKPQVEGLSIFEKAVMVGPIELNVVDGPMGWISAEAIRRRS